MRRAILTLTIVIIAGDANATDNKSDTITVIPWSDANVSFTPDQKSATLQYVELFGGRGGDSDPFGWQLYVKATAPLDQDTRIAAFANKGRLAAPFGFQLQFGFDQRAGRLQKLRDDFQSIATLSKALSKLPSTSATGWQAEYCRYNSSRLGFQANQCNGTNLITGWCKAEHGKSCEPADVVVSLEQAMCKSHFDKACDGATPDEIQSSFLEGADAYWTKNCSARDRRNNPTCFETAFLIDALERNQEAHQLDATVQDALAYAPIEALWEQLKGDIDSSLVTEIEKQVDAGAPLGQLLLQHAADLAAAIDKALQQNILMRRDLLLVGIDPGTKATNLYSLVFDASMAYDRMSVYQDDLATQPQQNNKFDIQLGLDGMVYFRQSGASLNLRVGWEGKQDPGATQVQRCETSPSTSMTISGQACDGNALFRSGPIPAVTNAAYVRAALDYQLVGATRNTKVIPGFELRGGLEGLGAAKSMDWRLMLYGTPTTGSAAARVGIGVDLLWALDDGAEGYMRRGTVAFVPFAVFGATATSLMGR